MSGLFVKAAVRQRYKDIKHVRPGGISEISGLTDSAKKTKNKQNKFVAGSNMWGADVSRLAAQLNSRV